MNRLFNPEGDRMRGYELVFIISPEIADEEVPDTIGRVSELVNKTGGNVTEMSQWGRRKLAYPIRRFSEGNYVLAQLELEPASAKELEANLRLSNEVMRHLLVRLGE